MKTIKDTNLKDKTILIRTDYNVPLRDGKITSDLRIRASLPTLDYLRSRGAAKIVIISHLGRPDGYDKNLSLAPVASALNKLIGRVSFEKSLAPADIKKSTATLKNGDILLLENLRFDPGEEQNDNNFIKSIIDAVNPDLYVQDGFAVLHRAHASTDAVKDFLPVFAGLLVEKEVSNLGKVMADPDKPLVLVLGGAKVADKQPLIDKFLPLADHILIGGKIAANGYAPASDKIIVASDFDEDASGEKKDIGPVSTSEFAGKIIDAKTIIWNGTLGHTEDPAYATASTIVAELMGEAEDKTTIVCGGDTTGFVENLIEEHPTLHYTLVSTGGGASLEFLLGNKMPGLDAISS
ncbi:phosphoglycerate kinase [Candidatus Saccharibacteria bacterium]|nr:phosphoglycerate kinase [Candidatus Saccharibacteria bacterium]